jgi:hypothetical protein
MKNITKKLILILALLPVFAVAQLSINNNETSVLLEFDDSDPQNTKGIILPAVGSVEDVPSVNGTFVFDVNDSKVKMRENNQWIELTGSDEAGRSTSLINNNASDIGNGAIVGATSSSVVGVLVLESSNKALKLPHVVKPHENVKSPYPGMMCYEPEMQAVAFFDGTKWYFWK